MHPSLRKPKGSQYGMQECMQHTCFAQRSSTLRTECKRGLSLRTLQEAFEDQQRLPTFRIREENCPISRYVLTRPNNVCPLIGLFIHANRSGFKIMIIDSQSEQVRATQTTC